MPIAETPPPRPLVTRRDSMLDSAARSKGPLWRSQHYPYADLHGPFPRPTLPDTADPNDPLAYYQLGDSVRHTLPGLADRAFYWAARLDPTFADAYFARWTLLRRDYSMREMPDGSIRDIYRLKPAVVVPTDSLLAIAIVYSPFLDGTLDVPGWILGMSAQRAAEDPTTAGLRAYGYGDYRRAVAEWTKALRNDPRQATLHVARAYAWVKLNESDSAIFDLSQLVRRMEMRDRDSALAPYLSKEFLYYAMGMLHATRERYVEARAAFEQALVENMGFYMAHVRLAGTLMVLNDTTLALNELETAILIRADNPLVLVYEGSILINTGRVAEGEEQLRAALRVDADYALPHVFLGIAAEARHDTLAARAEYVEYLARAPRRAGERVWATSRLGALLHR
jgi:tetratricopeptide (TPR) repeat protein